MKIHRETNADRDRDKDKEIEREKERKREDTYTCIDFLLSVDLNQLSVIQSTCNSQHVMTENSSQALVTA